MTCEFLDSMMYATDDIKYKWDLYPKCTIVTTPVRRVGTQAMQFGAGTSASMHYSTSRPLPGAFAGMAVRYSSALYSGDVAALTFETGSGGPLVAAEPNSDGSYTLEAFGGSITSDPSVFEPGVFHYLELGYTKHASAGTATIKVNDVVVAQLTGLNSDTSCSFMQWSNSISATIYFQDLYLFSGDGATNNTFAGDSRVDCLRPDGAGSSTDFTPSAGANWENVDELDCDEDATHNESTVVTDKDLYNIENISATGAQIFAVQHQSIARKTDASLKYGKQVLKSGSTEIEGDELNFSDNYVAYRHLFDNDPDTSSAWTESGVNGIESGIEVTA